MEKLRPSQRVRALDEELKLSLAKALDQKAWFQGSYEIYGKEDHLKVADNIDKTVSLIKQARENLQESVRAGMEIDPQTTKEDIAKRIIYASGALAGAGVVFAVMSNGASIAKALPW